MKGGIPLRVTLLLLVLLMFGFASREATATETTPKPIAASAIAIDNSDTAMPVADETTAIAYRTPYAPEVAYVDQSSSVATARSENQNFYGSTSTSTAPISAHVGHLNRATCWGRIDLGKRPGAGRSL